MQRAGLVKPDGARNRPGGRAEEECSAAASRNCISHIAMTVLMLLSIRINDLLTLIAALPNAASIRVRFYFGKRTLLLLFILFY
jgi:hypothetical protein